MARYLLLLLGVLLVWMSHAWGGPSEGAEDYDRLREEGQRSPGVVTAVDERTITQPQRRGASTRTERCPEITYQTPTGDRSFVEYDACSGWSVGDRVTVLVDPQGELRAHVDSDAVRETVAGDERTFTLGRWLGYGLAAGSLVVILLGWRNRSRRAA